MSDFALYIDGYGVGAAIVTADGNGVCCKAGFDSHYRERAIDLMMHGTLVDAVLSSATTDYAGRASIASMDDDFVYVEFCGEVTYKRYW